MSDLARKLMVSIAVLGAVVASAAMPAHAQTIGMLAARNGQVTVFDADTDTIVERHRHHDRLHLVVPVRATPQHPERQVDLGGGAILEATVYRHMSEV